MRLTWEGKGFFEVVVYKLGEDAESLVKFYCNETIISEISRSGDKSKEIVSKK